MITQRWMALAFAITCFYRVPPLRTWSALEEKNELANAALQGNEP